jgi:hypothetical protein
MKYTTNVKSLEKMVLAGYRPWVLYVQVTPKVAEERRLERQKATGRVVDKSRTVYAERNIPLTIQAHKRDGSLVIVTVDNSYPNEESITDLHLPPQARRPISLRFPLLLSAKFKNLLKIVFESVQEYLNGPKYKPPTFHQMDPNY